MEFGSECHLFIIIKSCDRLFSNEEKVQNFVYLWTFSGPLLMDRRSSNLIVFVHFSPRSGILGSLAPEGKVCDCLVIVERVLDFKDYSSWLVMWEKCEYIGWNIFVFDDTKVLRWSRNISNDFPAVYCALLFSYSGFLKVRFDPAPHGKEWGAHNMVATPTPIQWLQLLNI